MIICKSILRVKNMNISFNTITNNIEHCNKIKILWMFIMSYLSYIASINNKVFKINYRLHILKKVFISINIRTRNYIWTKKSYNFIKYSYPLLVNNNQLVINKLITFLIKCTRPMLGFALYELITTKVMKLLK